MNSGKYVEMIRRHRAAAPALCVAALMVLSSCAPVAIAGAGATAAKVGSQERSVGNAVDDLGIETQVEHKLFRSNFDMLFAKVDVDVIERRVFLTGNIARPEDGVKAVQLAWEVPGVKEVVNELQLDGGGSFRARTQDIWIQTQIKSRLLFTKGIHSANYNIESVDGIVYLMGIAVNEQELHNVTDIVSRTQGVRQVVSHVVLAGDERREPYKAK